MGFVLNWRPQRDGGSFTADHDPWYGQQTLKESSEFAGARANACFGTLHSGRRTLSSSAMRSLNTASMAGSANQSMSSLLTPALYHNSTSVGMSSITRPFYFTLRLLCGGL